MTQPWVKLRRLIREIRREYPAQDSGPGQNDPILSGIDIFWDGTGLTIEVCRDPNHQAWKRHAHRGLNSVSSDIESGEVVVSRE